MISNTYIGNLRKKVWNVLQTLRGAASSDCFVLFPLFFIRRIDCILSPKTKEMYDYYQSNKDLLPASELKDGLKKITNSPFYNISGYDLMSVVANNKDVAIKLRYYIDGLDPNTKDVLRAFAIIRDIDTLNYGNVLRSAIKQLLDIDLSIETVSNKEVWKVFSVLSELLTASIRYAGEYSTPTSLSRLMASLLFTNKEVYDATLYDSTCGMGGSLYIAKDYYEEMNSPRHLNIYGQEMNLQTFAITQAVALLSGIDTDNFRAGDSLFEDKFTSWTFDYVVSNFPFNLRWGDRSASLLKDSRFKIGIPNKNSADMLFIEDIISKMNGHGRACFITGYSALISGGFGSGENSVRKYLIDNDMVDCIIALPKLFQPYLGITSYLWILTKNKQERRRGQIQLINAENIYHKSVVNRGMNILTEKDIYTILLSYTSFNDSEISKVVDNSDFGELRLTIEQPVRKEYNYGIETGEGDIVRDNEGNRVADKNKAFTEIVPLSEDIDKYFETKIIPNIDEESWIDYSQTRIGYKFDFAKFFSKEKQSSLSKTKERFLSSKKAVANLNKQLNGDNVEEKLSHINTDWFDSKLKYVCKLEGGSSVKPSDYVDEGYAYVLQIKDIADGAIDFDSCNQVSEETFKRKKYIVLNKGDLVISVNGTVGKTLLFQGADKPVIMANGLVRVSEGEELYFCPKYFKQLFSSLLFTAYATNVSHSLNNIQRLSLKDLGEFSFKLPMDGRKQDEIAEILEHHDHLIKQLNAAIKEEQEALKEYREALFMKVLDNRKD